MLIIRCPACERENQVADEFAGRSVSCKVCGRGFRVGASVRVAASPEGGEPTKPKRPRSERAERDSSRRRERDEEDRSRRRVRRADDDDASPRRRANKEGSGALGIKSAAGGILFALALLLLLLRFIRVADKWDAARRDQRDQEEAARRASRPPEPKIHEFDANLAKLANKSDRFSVIYFSEQPFDPARQKVVARALEGCLQARDQWVGYDACQALKKWGDKDSVRPLVNFYDTHPDDALRSRALEALEAIKDPAAAEAVRAIKQRGR